MRIRTFATIIALLAGCGGEPGAPGDETPDGNVCIEWHSDLDGVLIASRTSEDALNFTSALSRGTYTITVTARDASRQRRKHQHRHVAGTLPQNLLRR